MDQNENSPRFDISTFVPLGVGAISLFGICLLLIASRIASPRSTVQVPDTATPFRYLFLGTEPGISSAVPSQDGTVGPDVAITGTRRVGFSITAQSGFSDGTAPAPNATQQRPSNLTPGNPDGTVQSLSSPTRTVVPALTSRSPTPTRAGITNTPVTLFTASVPTSTVGVLPTFTRTPTSVSAPPMNPGTYDDTDLHLTYVGNWVSQTNVGGAENNTLHVSIVQGNTITFRFIGDQLRIFCQSGSGLGLMTIEIDGEVHPAQFNQTVSDELAITGLTNATHSVTLTHFTGGSINLDQIIIPDITLPTATSTATATSTSTP